MSATRNALPPMQIRKSPLPCSEHGGSRRARNREGRPISAHCCVASIPDFQLILPQQGCARNKPEGLPRGAIVGWGWTTQPNASPVFGWTLTSVKPEMLVSAAQSEHIENGER